MPDPAGISEIPQSSALAEANPESLQELFSRDPEGYQAKDLTRIVEWMRAQRARWVKAEAEGKKVKAKKTDPVGPASISSSQLGLEDLMK